MGLKKPKLHKKKVFSELKPYADLKRAMSDVVKVHGENVVLTPHIHPILVLIHVQDPVVHRLIR